MQQHERSGIQHAISARPARTASQATGRQTKEGTVHGPVTHSTFRMICTEYMLADLASKALTCYAAVAAKHAFLRVLSGRQSADGVLPRLTCISTHFSKLLS